MFNFRNVVLGDHNLASDPDCKKLKFSKLCSPDRMKVKVEKAIVHESYSEDKSNNIVVGLVFQQKYLIFVKNLKPLVSLPFGYKWLNMR